MDATSVPGTVAGSGAATAMKPGIPMRLSMGVAMALPPFPNKPPRKPINIPIKKIER